MHGYMGYIMLIIATLAIGGLSSWYVNHQLKKYERVPNSRGVTGADVARGMLAYYGIGGVPVQPGGHGQDFFDPRTNSITLSPEAYSGHSITALATACHEVGHACQYAQGYVPMKVRTAIVPVVNLASNAWMFLFLIGIVMQIAGLVDIAIILYAVSIVFAVVTLPVEFDASRRAMAYMGSVGMTQQEQAGSFSVLRACALTYVAAALVSVLQLLYLLSQRQD